MRLSEIVGEKNVLPLIGNSAEELARLTIKYYAEPTEEIKQQMEDAFTKVCVWGFDLGFNPSKDAQKEIVQEVLSKMASEQKEKLHESN